MRMLWELEDNAQPGSCGRRIYVIVRLSFVHIRTQFQLLVGDFLGSEFIYPGSLIIPTTRTRRATVFGRARLFDALRAGALVSPVPIFKGTL